MKTHIRPALVAAFAGLLLLCLAENPVRAEPMRVAMATDVGTAKTIIRAALLAEPLVATAPTTAEEDQALAEALVAHERRARPDDVSRLANFVSRYPQSGWAAALQTNLGLSYIHDGHFSKALDAWKRAWSAGKSATEPQARALVDRAVGELARLYTSLGQFEQLAALFEEIRDRPIIGSATEAVQIAREQLSLLGKDSAHLFNCGPLALRSLLLARGGAVEQANFLQWHRVGPNGTSLAELGGLAHKAKFGYRLIFRKPGEPVPMPAIVHWKVGHFATILGEANGRFHVDDGVVAGRGLWVTPEALDSEASGYFLVPTDSVADGGWRTVDLAEGATVWGKGPSGGTQLGDNDDPLANGKKNGCPLCSYDIKESSVGVTLSDQPVGYSPPFGPSAMVRITYNQREDSQPAGFNFFNVGQKWTLNWLSYVTDDPLNAGASVSRYLPGGGAYYYTGYAAATGRFAAQNDDGSILVRATASPISYRHQLPDGGVEIYAQSDGATAFPRRIFLSQIIDPQGNALTLNYDSQRRLTSVTDATGRQTTLTYGPAAGSLLVTKITDPFGRSAMLTYDGNARLTSITDVIGLTSSFAYDANFLVNSMTTPYGTTTFAYTAPGTAAPPRFVQVTDPLGYDEREEWLEPAPVPATDVPATVPQGMPVILVNNYMQYRDSFHWDKNAYVVAGCTPTGGCDYSKARIRHFLHVGGLKSTAIESVKYPFENRIWFNYPGQPDGINRGTYNQPVAIGRVLDDGTTQLQKFTYDTTGYFKLLQTIDPLGRTTTFTYASQIDLAAIAQTTANGNQITIAQYNYNYQHRPIAYTDAAGQTTTFGYNSAGQPISVTNPLNQTTTYQYDPAGNLSTVVNANNVTAASYTYDAYDRVRTFTDSEGWTVTYDYDAADRVTKVTYPDGTFETYSYSNLDLVAYRDRQYRVWSYTYDANRRLTVVVDPAGRQVLLGYDRDDRLTSLTDPNTNLTSWSYDVQGRLTGKQYANTSTVTYAYENTTSRLKSVTDALGQVKTYSYAKDDVLLGITYTNAINPTPNVSFTYDPYFPRVVSMMDGIGTKQYTYVPVGLLGALQVQQESGPLASSAIASAYDELGRLNSRTVAGSGAETFQYDAIGRPITHANDLGSFTLSYLGQTEQMTGRQLAASTLATTWSYLNNTGDRRLSGINNVGLMAGQFSTYAFTTTPENFISGITETSDASAVYPAAGTQTATYNNLNQLTNLSGQGLTWDANGNLTSDGQRTYSWDAENRLVGIAYPGVTGKQTAFTYDGLGRRTAIASTPPGGGSAVTTSYLWCDSDICQARNASNAAIRGYYDEGEFVPGTPAQPYYYGIDQIGSVRRVFASTSSAPAYGYDPYGLALQATAPLTDFVYGGMFYNADSGLYLTQYRGYDPVAGRWLSRDPIGEDTDPAANLYVYVGGEPVGLVDPTGENPLLFMAAAGGGHVIGQLINSGGKFRCIDWGAAANAALLGGVGGGVLSGIFKRAAAALAARASAAGSLGANPFTGKTAKEVAEILGNKGYVPRGPDPISGRGTYVNPSTGRGYHIDATHPPPKGPHVGVLRPRGSRDILPPRDYPMGGP